jgi:hypothetical protein
MKYYFGAPQLMKTKDYTLLANSLMIENDGTVLTQEYNFFVLESCRFYIDGMDREELQEYYKLVRSAHDNLLIHRSKIESYFKDYVNSLFGHKEIERKEPQNISELVIDIMLSELDMDNILKHVNLGTQEVDVNSIKDSVKLDRINRVKKIHDIVLFFINHYNQKNDTVY